MSVGSRLSSSWIDSASSSRPPRQPSQPAHLLVAPRRLCSVRARSTTTTTEPPRTTLRLRPPPPRASSRRPRRRRWGVLRTLTDSPTSGDHSPLRRTRAVSLRKRCCDNSRKRKDPTRFRAPRSSLTGCCRRRRWGGRGKGGRGRETLQAWTRRRIRNPTLLHRRRRRSRPGACLGGNLRGQIIGTPLLHLRKRRGPRRSNSLLLRRDCLPATLTTAMTTTTTTTN